MKYIYYEKDNAYFRVPADDSLTMDVRGDVGWELYTGSRTDVLWYGSCCSQAEAEAN